MKATETKFLDFLKGPKQFIIPIYQRTYSWTLKQCEQLWQDIVRSATDETVSGHFVGSIVYIQKGLYTITTIPQLLVIDGQQRLTTVSILLAALGKAMGQHPELAPADITQKKLNNYFLLNADEDGDLRYKLLLTQSDKPTLIRLLENKEMPSPLSRRVSENFRFFEDRISAGGVDLPTLYNGIAKLLIVDIALDRERDNPQLIFESLNSTGLELSQADLIRNYILMGLEPEQQESLYNDYWFPMEQSFGHANYAASFDPFMRDFLTLKTGRIPNIREVYEAFKAYAQGNKSASIQDIVADIYRHSKHYVRIALDQEQDKELRQAIADINTLRVDVAYPFLLELYEDQAQHRLGREEVVAILKIIESYVFRRAVCGIPTNSMNKTFATLGRDLDKGNYLESFTAALLLRDSYRRFPDDAEFVRELTAKDLYNFRSRNYWFRKLENHDRKESVAIDEYTIEHVLPQNENLSAAWREVLGNNWKEIQTKYLHTLGNLTLTGYNAELSDRPFVQKRDMPGGFAESPIRLNKNLAKLDTWNETTLQTRAAELAEVAVAVWAYPSLSAEALATYAKPPKSGEGKAYTLADHPQLVGPMLYLFEQFHKRTLNLDASVTEEILKLYIAYKTNTNFVDVQPQKSRLRLMLNMAFDQINDPTGLCKDVTNLGRWGNGDVEVSLTSPAQLDDVMKLVRQSFDLHSDNAGD